jgi:hypothetical protein
MNKAEKIFIYGSFSILLAFVVYIFYLAIFPIKVAEFEKIEVMGEQYEAGDLFEFCMTTKKYDNYNARVTLLLTNGHIYRIAEFDSNTRGTGEWNTKCTSEFRIPDDIETGIYSVRMSVVYDLTILNTKTIIIDSNTFEVINEN